LTFIFPRFLFAIGDFFIPLVPDRTNPASNWHPRFLPIEAVSQARHRNLLMSALGQKQTFRAAERTSLFDHLVGGVQ
jgi:hypothetical protein